MDSLYNFFRSPYREVYVKVMGIQSQQPEYSESLHFSALQEVRKMYIRLKCIHFFSPSLVAFQFLPLALNKGESSLRITHEY